MDTNELKFCATDKEILDVLLGARQQITESVLFDLARQRGIFYSKDTPRDVLAEKISLLPHDYHDLNAIMSHRDHAGRAEKVTSITLNAAINVEDLKAVTAEYQESHGANEKVVANQLTAEKFTVEVTYSEIDYSKNRLVQRRQKEANIEFFIQDDKTTIRLPANVKAESIVQGLKNRLESRKKGDIEVIRIDLSSFGSPDARTKFFTNLISEIQGYNLENVFGIKVDTMAAPESGGDDDSYDDDADKENAKQEMLSIVKNVTMRGQSLLASPEYQQLRAKGFFITSISWSSKMKDIPFSIVEFDAGFESPLLGQGFKYLVRGVRYHDKGNYNKTLRPLPDDQKEYLLTLIESAAKSSITALAQSVVNDEVPTGLGE